jgi:hypothetical protein
MTDDLVAAFNAGHPDLEHRDHLLAFGRFAGAWDLDATYYEAAGALVDRRRGEWIFGWILGGRGVQDVVISPPRAERQIGDPWSEYGTTVRIYDPDLGRRDARGTPRCWARRWSWWEGRGG